MDEPKPHRLEYETPKREHAALRVYIATGIIVMGAIALIVWMALPSDQPVAVHPRVYLLIALLVIALVVITRGSVAVFKKPR